MSPNDYKREKLQRNEARKRIALVIALDLPNGIRFTRHAHEEMNSDGLTQVDILNVVESPVSRIQRDGELENGSYRYRLETKNIMVVIAFTEDGNGLFVITAWRK